MTLTRRNIKKILSANTLIIKREVRNINLFLFFFVRLITTWQPLFYTIFGGVGKIFLCIFYFLFESSYILKINHYLCIDITTMLTLLWQSLSLRT